MQPATDPFANREYYNLPIAKYKTSDTPGVSFLPSRNRWSVHVTDRMASIKQGKQVVFYVNASVQTKEAALSILAEKQTEENTKFWTAMMAQSCANPLTRELPLGREHPTEAEHVAKKVFWRPMTGKGNSKQVERVVTCRDVSKATGYAWKVACDVCNGQRVINARHCSIHFTDEEKRALLKYNADRFDITKVGVEKIKTLVGACSECGKRINQRRHVTNGGCGICPECELRHANEAREAGSEPLKANERWEDKCLDMLEKLVNHPCESRDSVSDMLGSFENKPGKRKRRAAAAGGSQQCDTTTKRRPDMSHVIRDEKTARMLVFISSEIEEDSHIGREIECELGKVDDTFEAVGVIGQREGFRDDRTGHNREDVVRPLMITYKLNPNGTDTDCDVPFTDRIALLASKINAWYAMPQDELRAMIDAGKNMTPIVECMFYHTRRAKKYLDAYAAAGKGAAGWQWKGNTLTTV